MRRKRSHGRLMSILVLVSIPTFCGLVAGFWISQEMMDDKQEELLEWRRKQVSSLAEAFKETLVGEIEALRGEAQALTALQKDEAAHRILPRGRLLHWAELKTKDSLILEVKKTKRNPHWNATPMTEEAYLRLLSQNLKPSEVAKNGFWVERVPQDPSGLVEWLSFSYPSLSPDGGIVSVLIDSSQAFQSYQRAISQLEGQTFRSYLVGRDGRILFSSQKSWKGKDLSSSALFQDQIQAVMNGAWRGGSGETMSLDQNSVATAYLRVGHLPLVVVTEQVIKQTTRSSGNGLFLSGVLILTLSMVTFLCSYLLKSFLFKVVTVTQKIPVQVRKPESVEGARFFSEDDLLLLDVSQTKGKDT